MINTNFTRVFTLVVFGLAATKSALAHCPLCTLGAGAAAVGASWLGVDSAPIGIFVGAFAVALGAWIARLLPKKYVPMQREALIAISFLTTVLPLLPLFQIYSSFYVQLGGGYGSLLNRTYLINLFLIGAIIGGILMLLVPFISKRISDLRSKTFPYQGMAISAVLLITSAVILQLWF